ncbi:Peptidase family M48 [Sphingomonas laterariae]|uniref:Peptidase family M48 n=1 Tax=Edaphosphingomonas laterariae TaxID=861865 RepID=A0A239CJP6_9SPHN|nr:M48 family metalloprotease [Sphingomonas laterariae]SNS19593.1 Peptidase family M48 [Sphingomonas laterariae]
MKTGTILAMAGAAMFMFGTGADAAPKKKRSATAAPAAPAPAPQPAVFVPEPPFVPLNGCPAPGAGTLPAAQKLDKKAKGKFSLTKAPLIATLPAAEVCANNQRMRSGGVAGEASLGLSAQVMNTRSARLDLFAMPATELELRAVLDRFAKAWPYAPLERTPKILFRASDAYEAQALPDNTIVVSLGLLEAAESDSEVLFVLAHEYAHLLLGHFTKAEAISGAKKSATAISQVYQVGSFANSLRGSGSVSGALSNAQSGAARSGRDAARLSEALTFAVDDIVAPSWNRDQEDQADALAIDLLIGSNMTIDTYANVFARLQKAFEAEKASRDKREALANTLQDSLTSSVKSMANAGTVTSLATGGSISALGTNLLKGTGSSLLNNIGSVTKAVGGDTHLPPEERRKGLAAYYQAGYPTADPPIDTGAMIGRIKANPEFNRATMLKANYIRARQSYFDGNYGGADQQLRALGAGTRQTPTFVNYVAGLSARDAGNTAMAASYFDAGRSGSGVQNLQLYESYAEMEINTRDTAAAEAVIGDGVAKFKDPDHFKSIEIKRELASGDAAGAQATYGQCMAVKGRDYIPERCKAAMPQAAQAKKNPLGIDLPFGN